MSKVRDLPQIVALEDNDLLYAVDFSAGPNGGRKITKEDLKASVAPTAAETKIAYESNPDTNAFTDAEETKLAGIEVGATADQNANEVPYDNSVSLLSATDVKAALDELAENSIENLRVVVTSGLIVSYSAGIVWFDGVFTQVLSGALILNANVTDGYVYVDLDAIVKQTASGIAPPAYTVPLAKFTTDAINVVSLTDAKARINQQLVRGLVSDVRDVRAGAAAAEGTSGRLSDAMHKHNILTAAPSTQVANQGNSEGNLPSLARADHIHDIQTAAPSTNLSPATANAEGAGVTFAKSNHTHNVATALVADITTILPDDAASAGVADNYSRGDHKHAIAAATAANQTPDQASAEGVSTSFARADHVHNIPAANVSTIGTANSKGVAASFALSDHIHNHGVQTDPTLHGDATPSSDGFMTAADKTKLDTLVFGFLSYTNNGTQTTTQNNTAFTAVVLDTDTGSLANSLLTKTNTTTFRTDFNGYIRVSFKIRAQNTSANDDSWRGSVLKNGTEILHTRCHSQGKTNAERYGSMSGSFLLACATNDLFTIGYSNAEATTDSITIAASGASVNVHAIYKTS